MVDLEKVIVEQSNDKKLSIRSHPTMAFTYIVALVVTFGPILFFLLWGTSLLFIGSASFLGLFFVLYYFTTDRIELTATEIVIQSWYLYPIRKRFRYSSVTKEDCALVFHGKSNNRLTLDSGMSPFAGGFLTIKRNKNRPFNFGGEDCADWLFREVENWLLKQGLAPDDID